VNAVLRRPADAAPISIHHSPGFIHGFAAVHTCGAARLPARGRWVDLNLAAGAYDALVGGRSKRNQHPVQAREGERA
jgi:hypothetical protein